MAAVTPRSRHRAFVASLSGTALEYYDFAIYSSAAALLFGQLFFADQDPLTGLFSSFATYAVGFVARPIGGLVFGRLGDIIGRKQVLVYTLLLVGTATFLIGLLPTYATIGTAAPALLVLLRFAQGVGVGGEWGGAVLLSSEFGREGERGFWASAAQVGPPLGTLLANGVIALLALLIPNEDFIAWGWRIAFLLSAALVGFGLWIRSALEETPVFAEIAKAGEQPERPLAELFRTHRKPLIASILVRIGPDVLYAMFAVFVLTYATTLLGVSKVVAVSSVLIGSALQVPLIPLAGYLSDRLGRRRVYAAGAVGAAIWSLAFVHFAEDETGVMLGTVGALFFHALMYGPQAALISEQFEVRLRYTGSSLAYTLAGLLGGATAPLCFVAFMTMPGGNAIIGFYLAGACAITLVGLAQCRPASAASATEARNFGA